MMPLPSLALCQPQLLSLNYLKGVDQIQELNNDPDGIVEIMEDEALLNTKTGNLTPLPKIQLKLKMSDQVKPKIILNIEKWLPIRGYEHGYQVSNHGQIRSLAKNKITMVMNLLN